MTVRDEFEVEYADFTQRPLADIQALRIADTYSEAKVSAAYCWFKRGRNSLEPAETTIAQESFA